MDLPAQQVFSREFDADFFRLAPGIQDQIEAKLDELATRLDNFPHQRLAGNENFRLRVGHYRIVYSFNLAANVLYVKLVGHRREIYREL